MGRLIGGRYRLHGERALGGMATIWRATDEQTGDAVAVKLLHPHLVADEAARERLTREAALLRTLHHPNIVQVRDVVVGTSGPALVMEFIEGRSLAERLAEGGTSSEHDALGVLTDVASALAAVHAQGLVHRDVKPGNILIGTGGRTRLIDFGIAADSAVQAMSDASALTAPDGVIGTLRYLAPERLDGRPATAATDVWGLGAVGYEMIAGAPPFPANSPNERVAARGTSPIRPPNVSDGLWTVLTQALAEDPAERHADGSAMAVALRGVAAPAVYRADPWAATRVVPMMSVTPARAPDKGISASVDASPRPSRVLDRPRALVAGLGVLALVTVIGLGTQASADGSGDVRSRPSGDAVIATSPSSTGTTPGEEAEAQEVDGTQVKDPPGKAKGANDKGKGGGKGKRD